MWNKLFGVSYKRSQEELEQRVLFVYQKDAKQFFPQRIEAEIGSDFFAIRGAVANLLLLTPLSDIDFIVPHALEHGIVLWVDLRDTTCGILMRFDSMSNKFVGINADEGDQSIDITWPRQLQLPEGSPPPTQPPLADNNSNTLVTAKRARRSGNGRTTATTHHK